MDAKNTDDTPKKKEPKWWAPFFDTLGRTGNVLFACKAAGVKSRMTAYASRAKHPAFAKRWDDAMENGTDLLEAEARRRALHGTEKGVYHQGKKVDTVKEYSDTLMIFLLKAHRPEKFRDNYDLRRLIETYSAQRSGDVESGPVGEKGG